MDLKEDKITKRKSPIPIIIGVVVALLLVAAIIVVVVAVGFTAVKARNFDKLLEKGEYYLSELDYENSILAYKEAIQMDPKSEAIYISIANAYLAYADSLIDSEALDDARNTLEEGIDILKQGEKNTGSDNVTLKREELEDKAEEVDALIEKKAEEEAYNAPFYASSPEEAPSGLEGFFGRTYYITRDYDCESEEKQMNVAYSAMFIGYEYMEHEEFLSEDYSVWYYSYNPDEVDWVLKNVFNVSDAMIPRIREEYLKEDGKYRIDKGGIGGPETYLDIKSVETNGKLYHVVFEEGILGYEEEYSSTYYAIMEYKNVDGREFWSLYKMSKTPLF
ncbi:MAG: hypothetical protein IKP92_08970 [Lachnospiraceae bacterium]|nr:hypothetical protein [Lachnospiraceae bacterium]